MNESEYIKREYELRAARVRIVRAIWEYINGEYAKIERPSVQRLSCALRYDAAQMIADIQNLYADTSESWNYGRLLDRLTARYNSEVEQNHRAGELDFIPEYASSGDIIRIALVEYAMKHSPDLLHKNEEKEG